MFLIIKDKKMLIKCRWLSLPVADDDKQSFYFFRRSFPFDQSRKDLTRFKLESERNTFFSSYLFIFSNKNPLNLVIL